MTEPEFQKYCASETIDCSELAEDLLDAANGEGNIIEIAPVRRRLDTVQIPEANGVLQPYSYHQVYSDGNYIFDPRLHLEPLPQSDYLRLVKGLNPNAEIKILPKE